MNHPKRFVVNCTIYYFLSFVKIMNRIIMQQLNFKNTRCTNLDKPVNFFGTG